MKVFSPLKYMVYGRFETVKARSLFFDNKIYILRVINKLRIVLASELMQMSFPIMLSPFALHSKLGVNGI